MGQSIAGLQSELEAFEVDSANADRFIEISKKYTDFTELTTPMILEFVEKILVHEGDRSSGRREQRVDIYLNFIGLAKYLPPTEIEITGTGETVEERKRQLYLANVKQNFLNSGREFFRNTVSSFYPCSEGTFFCILKRKFSLSRKAVFSVACIRRSH